MDFDTYQRESSVTAVYPDKGKGNWFYPILGLMGESGEVCEKLKKIIRDKDGIISVDDLNEIELELGDVLYYLSAVCRELGLNFNSVAKKNLEKVLDRKKRGVIRGSGDNR